MSTLVHAAVTADGVALMDIRRGRGRWHFLDRVSAELWSKVAAGQTTTDAIDELVHAWQLRGVNPDQVRADLKRVAAELHEAELLVAAGRPARQPGPPAVRFAGTSPSTLRDQISAQAGLALALVLLRCLPIRFTITAAQAAARLPGRSAAVTEAERLHAAVQRATRAWPGRAACLEESLAVYLAAALSGRRVRWVLGASFMPRNAHAWVEAGGTVIGQEPADRVWPYAAALQVEHPN
ncbi:lasso peptide biosynthesis B2 protein [Streptomyces sp. A1547]|uniref:lasso peptide biosynthesis B2 protein n=1 Tax=Streptomyces sp. A1547 TaxID=2563105 RepID=UPI00109E8154|nr:lasso peptide biosynthesis B2 protein [Streptomyces sp. A1547]THA38144.1 lasso peptide biosynthesis B2 protein [Streptomyces sp. A1547]